MSEQTAKGERHRIARGLHGLPTITPTGNERYVRLVDALALCSNPKTPGGGHTPDADPPSPASVEREVSAAPPSGITCARCGRELHPGGPACCPRPRSSEVRR